MRQSNRRSSSLQRSSRAGSAKRGPRASTPSRRLSDLPERPAWDATSSNLEKFKLSTEEQERRKASRVSKNRPLGSDTRRSFVEAWAKHVTTSVLQEDTQNDQDLPRSTSPAGNLPINYGNVVEMLRKSPAVPGVRVISVSNPGAPAAAATLNIGGLAGQGPSSSSTGTSGNGTLSPGTLGHRASSSLSPEPGVVPLSTHGFGATVGGWAAAVDRSAKAGLQAAEGPELAYDSRREQKQQPGAGLAMNKGRAAEAGSADSRGSSHRGELSVAPVALRPRFNSADATTIIAFGGDSDSEDKDEADGGQDGSPGLMLRRAGEADPVTAAFEAALFGHGIAGTSGGEAAGGGMSFAWASSPRTTSLIENAPRAQEDVERRLRVLETTLATSTAGGGSVLHEDLADMRRELHKVQQDNAKLRQELGAFSSHASVLLTQLQAQVQQLLRPSAGAPAAAPPQPHIRQHPPLPLQQQPQQQHPPLPLQQQPAAAAAPPASIPMTTATYSLGPGLSHVMYNGRTQSQQHAPQSALQMPLMEAQSVARRNIFADLDISAIRPLGPASARAGCGEGTGAASTPHAAYAAGSGRPVVEPASSPLIDVAAAPYTTHPFPADNLDEADVALPSFAAFRRSAGTAAFTSARPVAGGAPPPLVSPSFHPGGSSDGFGVSRGAAGTSPPAAVAAVQSRSFPTQYQPRSLGGVLIRTGPNTVSSNAGASSVASAAAASAASTASSGAYAAALSANAVAAAATGSDAAAASLARAHSGLPQPLVFSMGPEFRTLRGTGLSAENSMSLSAHTAAAAAGRSKASIAAAGVAH